MRDRDRSRRWYDQRQWRPSYRAPRRYKAPRYYAPRGYYVRTWYYNDYLPWGWYTPSYYLNWWSYGLPAPPIGTEWVRVGDDALLVDVWTGRVLTIYYDIFW
jgi:Ni/Co efflux regulator RcnB